MNGGALRAEWREVERVISEDERCACIIGTGAGVSLDYC